MVGVVAAVAVVAIVVVAVIVAVVVLVVVVVVGVVVVVLLLLVLVIVLLPRKTRFGAKRWPNQREGSPNPSKIQKNMHTCKSKQTLWRMNLDMRFAQVHNLSCKHVLSQIGHDACKCYGKIHSWAIILTYVNITSLRL